MVRKSSVMLVVMLGLVSVGCQAPFYGNRCGSGYCSGTCAAVPQAGAVYYKPTNTGYTLNRQQVQPTVYSGGSVIR